jgi:hypothetical protein
MMLTEYSVGTTQLQESKKKQTTAGLFFLVTNVCCAGGESDFCIALGSNAMKNFNCFLE